MSPYVKRLRELVGSELLLLPSVATLPRDEEGRILLVRQSDSGLWASIGGAIDIDETPEDAARRETREEAGVEVELMSLLGVFGGPGFYVTYPNGDTTAYVSIVYDARIVGGTPKPDGDETVETGWFRKEEIRELDLLPVATALFSALDWW